MSTKDKKGRKKRAELNNSRLIFVISFLFRFVLTSVISHALACDYYEGDYF